MISTLHHHHDRRIFLMAFSFVFGAYNFQLRFFEIISRVVFRGEGTGGADREEEAKFFLYIISLI